MKPKEYPLPIAGMTRLDAFFYASVFKLAIEFHKQLMDFNKTFEYGPQATITKEDQLERDEVFLSQMQSTLEQIQAREQQILRQIRKEK